MQLQPQKSYDVVVVGGGHAGCEAALVSARLGCRTLLVTMRHQLIAFMPCNPSVGGIAKSHLVFELDALGGEMAKNTDYTGIQFRLLNTRKGPSVQASRAQCDKAAYACRMQAVIAMTDHLEVIEGVVSNLVVRGETIGGIELSDGRRIGARTVVLTPGTALGGRIHIGDRSFDGGGNGEGSSRELSTDLRRYGFVVRRLKTGTPPRLDSSTIDYSVMEIQPGVVPPPFFSWTARREYELFHVEHRPCDGSETRELFHVEHQPSVLRPWDPGSDQMPCFLTHTTIETHDIVRSNLDRSSLYGGFISGTGVRYCPSLEDKVVKFPDKDSHHVFIEPEGRRTNVIYPNGISNSLPADVQHDLIHSIPGLTKAKILDLAFAIEYDFCDPTQLKHSLQSKIIRNLYLAGQINGTTGYEEAAAQGFIAGANAAFAAMGEEPIVMSRSEAYIGVLIDDLVTKGTDEPYRMFTSRAENRLMLRQSNARYRLLSYAKRLSILSDAQLDETDKFAQSITRETERLESIGHSGYTLTGILRRTHVSYSDLPSRDPSLHPDVVAEVETVVKYAGYIEREKRNAEHLRRIESLMIPDETDYWSIKALRRETQEKLSRIKPESIGQASRVPGVTPADISIISVFIERNARRQ